MCLIETGDVPVNIALGGPAYQISDFPDQQTLVSAKNAVDGNMNSIYSFGSCSRTNINQNSWWAVDLQQSQYIDYVIITNRGDSCCNVYFVVSH